MTPTPVPVTSHDLIEEVLSSHLTALNSDLPAYRNHVYRGLNYQLRLLGDRSVSDEMALAWAVHDLGIWAAGTFDYLGPSVDLGRSLATQMGLEDIQLVVAMVASHHSLTAASDPLVETFRLADRADAFRGRWRGGLTRTDIAEVVAALPYHGFHAFLARRFAAHALRHPLKPVPMMRRRPYNPTNPGQDVES